jgi:BirA family biotin operon repressor/biotin-[acetyl-CoA-carboxylase] ligase
VVGVGLNINQTNFEGLQDKAVSLKQITGKEYNVISLAKELRSYLFETFTESKQNKPAIIEAYQQYLYKLNNVVKFKKQTRLFEATVKGVTNDGRLKVEHGVEELLEVGSVEWVI